MACCWCYINVSIITWYTQISHTFMHSVGHKLSNLSSKLRIECERAWKWIGSIAMATHSEKERVHKFHFTAQLFSLYEKKVPGHACCMYQWILNTVAGACTFCILCTFVAHVFHRCNASKFIRSYLEFVPVRTYIIITKASRLPLIVNEIWPADQQQEWRWCLASWCGGGSSRRWTNRNWIEWLEKIFYFLTEESLHVYYY